MESNDKLLHCDIVVLVEESVGLDPRRIQTRRFFGGSAAAASPAADDDSNDGGSVVFGIVFPDGMEARRSGFIRAVNSVRTVILRYTTVLLDGAGRVRGNVRAGKCGKNCKN